MSFGIEIKIDSAGAEPAIARVERALDKAEKAGEQVGKVATKALRETGLAAEKAKAPADSLAKSFGGLNAELQREAAILDRLRGPSLRYNEELKTLDRMLDQNKISVAEYTAELTKMNRALEGAAAASAKVKAPDPKKMIGGAAKLGAMGAASAGFGGGMFSGIEAGLAVGGGLGLAIAAAPFALKALEEGAILADKGLTKLSNVLNASTIAARKANEEFIRHARTTAIVFAETKKAEDAVKALNAARAAGSDAGAVDGETLTRKAGINALLSQNAFTGAFMGMKLELKEAEKYAYGLADGLNQMKANDAAGRLARDVERAHQSMNGMGNLLRGQIDDWKDLATKVDVLKKALAEIQARRAAAVAEATKLGLDPTNFTAVTRGDVDVVRGLRDATIQLDNVNNRYGKTVADIKLQTVGQKDAIVDLKGAYKAGEITLKEYSKALAGVSEAAAQAQAAYKALYDGITGPQKNFTRDVGMLNAMFEAGRINSAQYNEQLIKLRATLAGVSSLETPKGFVGAKRLGGVDLNFGIEKNNATGFNAQSIVDQGVMGSAAMTGIPEIAKAQELLNMHFAKTPSLLDDLKAGYAGIATTSDVLLNAFKGLEDALVSFVTTGKIEFSSLVTSILADLTRMLAQKALMSLFNALTPAGGMGALQSGIGSNSIASALFGGSHAFGGDYRVGGSGGPDSQRVMFNLTPGEHVRFTPPGRDPDSGGSAAPEAKQPIIVNMAPGQTEADLERVFLKFITRHNAAIRSTLTGR